MDKIFNPFDPTSKTAENKFTCVEFGEGKVLDEPILEQVKIQ